MKDTPAIFRITVKPVFVFSLFIFLVCFCNRASAQSKIRGNITDAHGKAIGQANILLVRKSDSALVKGMLSDSRGGYVFTNIPAGSYLVSGSSTGFQNTFSRPFEIASDPSEINVPTLVLQQEVKELSAVTVTARKPLYEQKMDRLVINVSGSITAAGSTALDVLERSPGIMVDRQNNSISMNGKNGVMVMMNGKISRMPMTALVQMLAGMSANNIEKIELITTPPANFDAEGNAGYINIVLKENTQYGTNGSLSASAAYGNGPEVASAVNINHRNRKINLYGDHSFSRDAVNQEFGFYRRINQSGKEVESYINSARDPVTLYNNARLGADLQWNKKTMIGVLLTGFERRWTMDAFNKSEIFLDKKLDTLLHIANREIHNTSNFGANLNMVHNFRPGERLTVDADYVYYLDHNPTGYLNNYYNGSGVHLYSQQTASGKRTPIRFWVGNAGYSKKLGEKVDMETGAKGTLSRFTNDVSVQSMVRNAWVADEALTAKYYLKESILAAFASFSFTFSDKVGAKTGLRYEYTNSNLNTALQKNIVDRHYGNLFPTAFFSWKIDTSNAVNLSWNRRITRPTFNDMAPFVIFMDPNTFFSGNPALQPSISNGYKADYLFKQMVFSLSYTYETNPITNFSPKVDVATNKQTLAAENQKSNKIVNVILSVPVSVTKWWNMQYNAIGLWQQLDAIYKGDPLVIRQKTLMVRSTQSFTLPKGFSAELSGFYHSAGLFGIYKVDAFGALDIGVQKKFEKIHSNLRLGYNNILNSLKFNNSVHLPEQNIDISGSLQFSYPTIGLTFTHNFGNQKLAAKRERSSAEEERQRVQAN